MSPKSDAAYRSAIEEAFKASWELVNQRDGWSTSKTTTLACDSVDKVEWRPAPKYDDPTGSAGRRMYRVTATLPGSVERVAGLLRDVDGLAGWNKAVRAGRVVKRLDPDTVIAYHLTASNGGLIFPRDFVVGIKFGLLDGCFVAGGCSVDFPPMPAGEDLVRAWNHPGCMVARPVAGVAGGCSEQEQWCTFQWLLDCHYGGWVPRGLMDLAMPFAQVAFVDSLCKALKQGGGSATGDKGLARKPAQ